MKFNSFSILVGTGACNATCPYCISRMTGDAASSPHIRQDALERACLMAQHGRDGLIPVILTGKGEPLLYPDQISEYLQHLEGFPIVELQTNGSLLQEPQVARNLANWRAWGLSRIAISIAHHDADASNLLMGITNDSNCWRSAATVLKHGFDARISVTLTKAGVHTIHNLKLLVSHCLSTGVDQLTVREVERVYGDHPVAKWIDANKPVGAIESLREFLDNFGTRLMVLPHGAIVYDYHGLSICLANCLTESKNPDNIRQLIFHPDGRIRYSWQYRGATI